MSHRIERGIKLKVTDNANKLSTVKDERRIESTEIVNFDMKPKDGRLSLNIDVVSNHFSIDHARLAIVNRATDKKNFKDIKMMKIGENKYNIQCTIADWKELSGALSIKSMNNVLDFYIAYSSEEADITEGYARVGFDVGALVYDETMFFVQDGPSALVLQPYATIYNKFSIKIGNLLLSEKRLMESRGRVLADIEKIAVNYFLLNNKNLEEKPDLVVVKAPKESVLEAKLIHHIVDHVSASEVENHIYICNDTVSEDRRKLLEDKLPNRVRYTSANSEENFKYLATAKYEYSVKEGLQLNSTRSSNAFVKNANLKKLNMDETEIQVSVELNLKVPKEIESVRLQLIERDSNEVRYFTSKKIEKINDESTLVDFKIKISDFMQLAQHDYWMRQGVVDPKLSVKLEGIPTIKTTVKIGTTASKKDGIFSDFFVETSGSESFVIAPYFEKKNGRVALGTAVVETKILKKYVIKANLRFPVMKEEKQRMASYYAARYDSAKINQVAVLYETRKGRSLTCSPYAIFKSLVNDPKYSYLEHYWVVKKAVLDDVKRDFPNDLLKRIKLVVKDSKEYIDLLLEAKYLIVNGTSLKNYFRKREGQVYINTWHGVPLKNMGYDTKGITRFKNATRQLTMLDYLISPNSHTTNVFVRAYKMQNNFRGEILEYGYPRMDVTVSTDKKADNTSDVLSLLGKTIELDHSKPILLYMPTWRGSKTKESVHGVETLIREVLGLKEKVADSYNILIKVHPFLYEYVKDEVRLSDVLVSDLCDPNEILLLADVMIADYSSALFDFMPTRKPIIYYMKDREVYEKDRGGLYISPDDLPGVIAYNLNDLVDILRELALSNFLDDSAKREEFIKTYSPLDDGSATKRVIEHIFENKTSDVGKVIKLEKNKKRILVRPDSLEPSETTSSYINMTHQIDYDQYDVTQFCKPPSREKKTVEKIHPSVRQVFVFGAKLYSIEEIIMGKFYTSKASPLLKAWMAMLSVGQRDSITSLLKAYKREESKLMPNNQFDKIINFGKNPSGAIKKLSLLSKKGTSLT